MKMIAYKYFFGDISVNSYFKWMKNGSILGSDGFNDNWWLLIAIHVIKKW